MPSTSSYTVQGMTCDHCARSVTEEVTKIPGVTAVEVDVDSGRLTLTSGSPVPPAAVTEAVEEAGYTLSGAGGHGAA